MSGNEKLLLVMEQPSMSLTGLLQTWGSFAIPHPQGPESKPELILLPLWNFACSSCVHVVVFRYASNLDGLATTACF